MNLGISNIAWDFSDDVLVYEYLLENNVKFLEVAPARIISDINSGKTFNTQNIFDNINLYGLKVSSAQAILFGTNDLSIFHRQSWDRFFNHLKIIFKFCNDIGISKVVFGSPKSRKFNSSLSVTRNVDEAIFFFNELSKIANQYHLIILVEANPKEYDCDFLNFHHEVSGFIDLLALDNIKMQIDTGAALMEGKTGIDYLINGDFFCQHVHLSLPFLNSNYEYYKSFFIDFINKLRSTGYNDLLIIEMKKSEDSLSSVIKTIQFFNDLLIHEKY